MTCHSENNNRPKGAVCPFKIETRQSHDSRAQPGITSDGRNGCGADEAVDMLTIVQ
jgi:hypothetical protein